MEVLEVSMKFAVTFKSSCAGKRGPSFGEPSIWGQHIIFSCLEGCSYCVIQAACDSILDFQVLAMSRNYLTGNTESLQSAELAQLQTLSLSSNRFSVSNLLIQPRPT